MQATAKNIIWDIIEKHKKSAHLSSRYVGTAPTHEWTGLATDGLKQDLVAIDYGCQHFISDVRGQDCYGKKCVAFTTFGNPPA